MINLNTNVDVSNISSQKLQNLDPSKLKGDKLKDVCDNFESFFMKQLMDVSLRTTNIAGEGVGSDIVKGMYTEAVSDNSSGSLGISDMLYKFLSEKN